MEFWNLFTTTSYTFLQLDTQAAGNKVIAEFPAEGVVKLRDGMVQDLNMEMRDATSTVHVKPTEAFIDTVGGNLVGHGIRVAKDNHNVADYRIESQVEGYDFDAGELVFYKVTLKRANTWDESNLPLE